MLNSCEESVTNVELPYVEQLVIRAVLEPGLPVSRVEVQKTLHPLERYDRYKALVSDAILVISDGINNYTLNYAGEEYYNDELVIQSGKTYTLRAEWKGKTATSKTTVPEPVEIDEIKYEIIEHSSPYDDYKYKTISIYTEFVPNPNYVYQVGFLDDTKWLNYGYEIYNYNNRNENGKIKAKFIELSYEEGMTEANIRELIEYYQYLIFAYDMPFYGYFNTRDNGHSNSGIFGSDGLNVQWNIYGDGIGLFIGRATTTKKF